MSKARDAGDISAEYTAQLELGIEESGESTTQTDNIRDRISLLFFPNKERS
jgi:hypothetical protein